MRRGSVHARQWLSQLGWLAFLWLAGVLCLGIVAGVLHGCMALAGLTAG